MKQDPTERSVPWFRRKYWLNHAIQKEFTIFFAGIFLIIELALYVALRVQYRYVLAACTPSEGTAWSSCQQMLGAFGSSMGIFFAVVAGVGGAFIAIGAIVLTHRIVGPMMRLSQELEKFENGNGSQGKPLEFRKDDFFADLPKRLNQVLKRD